MIATASRAQPGLPARARAEPLDYAAGDIPARVRELTGDGGADAAIDLFGGDGREEAFASLRRGGRLVSVAQPPPEPRDGYEVHYVFVRPDGDELRELVRRSCAAASCARTSRRSSRSSGPPRRTSAWRAATCAGSSCSASRLNSRLPIDPSSASVAPERLDEEAHARARLRLVVGAADQPGLVEVGQVDRERHEQRDQRQHDEQRDRRGPRAASGRRRPPSAASPARRRAARSRGGRLSTCARPSGPP